MIIYSKANGIIGVPYKNTKKGPVIGRVDLLPGNNDISKEIWEKARIECQSHIDRGVIVEKFAVVDGDKLKEVKEFKELEPALKEEIVEDTYNENTLDEWKKEEGADSVRSAISNQKESIKKYEPKKGKKATE